MMAVNKNKNNNHNQHYCKCILAYLQQKVDNLIVWFDQTKALDVASWRINKFIVQVAQNW